MDPKTQQFLLGPENRPSTPKYPSTKSPKRSGTYLCSIRVQILVHVFLVLLYTLASFAVIQKNKLETSKRSSHAPQALDDFDVFYDSKTYDLRALSSLFGDPTNSSTDESWARLLAPANIRVTATELARNNRNSVALPDGGYLAWMGVFHEIHCVNLLRQWKYRNFYYPNISPERENLLQYHTDHCLDRIRATLMCKPDTSSLVTFDWRKVQKPVVNGTKTLHSCVNWDHMIESTRSRRVSSAQMKRLTNPFWNEDEKF